jgi:DUF2892 family protein
MLTEHHHRKEETPMNIDRLVLLWAGSVVLISLGLSQIHSVYWLWLTAFAGVNLIQSAFTGFCPLAMLLRALKVPGGTAFRGQG